MDQIRGLIAEHLGCEAESIIPEHRLKDDLNADSLDCIELAMSLEEEFDVEISDDEFSECITVNDVNTLIERKLESAKTS